MTARSTSLALPMEMTPATASVAGLMTLNSLGSRGVDPRAVNVELPIVVMSYETPLKNALTEGLFYRLAG